MAGVLRRPRMRKSDGWVQPVVAAGKEDAHIVEGVALQAVLPV